MKIVFFGASQTVTGSSYLLTSDSGTSVLIDYGMFQGVEDKSESFAGPVAGDNFASLDCDVSKISGMILTHAHLDHCGRIPRLLRQGFNTSIWMTQATRDITEVSLFDSAKVNKNNEKDVLYTKNEVEKVISLFKTTQYENKFNIGSFEIVMRDAGHILGSASLEITDTSAKGEIRKIVFSGDLGNSPQDLIKETQFINESDVVVMESTYGDKDHPEGIPSEAIAKEIKIIEQKGGVLLIPSFSIQRSQELMHIIYHLKKSGEIKPYTQVLFDSPMAEKVTNIFSRYKELYNDEFRKDFDGSNPFNFPGQLIRYDENIMPQVIVAGSGMMTGGKIIGYAAEFLPISSTRVLIVGYQGEKTLGRDLIKGNKLVTINGENVSVNATINHIETMSSHAGQSQLLKWLKNINGAKKVFLTHGEDGPRNVLAEKIKTELKIEDITMPKLNDEALF